MEDHKKMARALKFLAVFVLATIVTFGGILGWNWKSFSIFLDNRQAFMEGNEWVTKTHSLRGMSEYIAQNPQNVSLASVVISKPDSSIYFMEDTPRAMGTTINFFTLVAYADLISAGEKDPDQMIRWSEITPYQLPDVDESLHSQSYRVAEEYGWIDDEHISLDNALHLLAEYNDLALADYLWWQIDNEYWSGLQERIGVENTDMPLPYSGLYIAISPGLQNSTTDEILQQWDGAGADMFREHVRNQSNRYAVEGNDRDNIRDYMTSNRLGNTFMEERDALDLFPKTTAQEMVQILEQLYNDELINDEVSQQVRSWMNWPMERQQGITNDFRDYGAIYDNRMGLLNGIDFGTSAYTGDRTVQVVLFDQLPIGLWFHMSSGHMHQDFLQRLLFDPAMIDQMNLAIRRYHTPDDESQE